jgi:hypothetical protein
VRELNGLAESYRNHFDHQELPHPKMDAVADRLAGAFGTGQKALVFVRRVKSVDELAARLNHTYDELLFARLRAELADRHLATLAEAQRTYREAKPQRTTTTSPSAASAGDEATEVPEDRGDTSSFFAYFFRGVGPAGILSGAQVNERINRQTGSLATFFAENHVMRILDRPPGSVAHTLAAVLEMDEGTLREEVRMRSRHYLSEAKDAPRALRFAAAQAAALELLAPRSQAARVVYDELFRNQRGATVEAAADIDQLERVTFFSELRRRPRLYDLLMPSG